ncbi:MAG: DMT family transporter [Planctomycetota bacterium]
MLATTTLRRPELEGHVALVMVQLCFGLFPLFGKWAFTAFEPSAVAGWRVLAGAAAFFTLALAVHGKRTWPAVADFPRLAACALLGVALNQVLYLHGLQRTTAVNAGLLMMLIPVFTFTIAVWARQERYVPRRGAGILIAFLGTTMLMLDKGPSVERGQMFGNLLIAANTLSYSLFLVLSRPLMRRYPPLVMIAWAYVLSLWTVPVLAHDAVWAPPAADRAAWLSLGLILLFPTILGYLFNLFALARVTASTTAVYIFIQPLISGVAGVAWLGETVRSSTLVAASVIVLGLWLVTGLRRR